MRERISMKSKMLGALALFTLIGALFVMQSAATSTLTVDAAAGSIDALNVGTCLTTDAELFKGEDCGLSGGTGSGSWEIRDEVAQVSTLYATYAHDPKTQSDAPRAILMDSDLIMISIADSERDRRTGVLIGNDAANNGLVTAADSPALTELGVAIKGGLDAEDLDYPDATDTIEYTHVNFDFVTGFSTDYVIATSGNLTLNFGYIDDTPTQPLFLPGDFNVDGGAIVRFYGCVADNNDTACDMDTGDSSDDIKNLKDYLSVDEDSSNGEASGKTAPWLGVNASVPSASDIIILAVYYRTSNEENLVGGERYRHCGDDNPNPTEDNNEWSCASGTLDMNDDEFDVDFTDDEKDDNDALMVSARADGDLEDRHVNLFLTETARFSGVYRGHLRLTDANGDGRDANSVPAGDEITDWGRQVGDGSSESDADAAVLAVESGPVTIEYRDSEGNNQTLRIEIDNLPPAISVTSPANGSSSGDQTPDFEGSIEDADSGLADKSFRLVADNKVDKKDGVEGKNDGFALDGKAPTAEVEVATDGDRVSSIGDYSGYVGSPLFGVVSPASKLYNLGDDACSDDQDVCHILSDEYDDGANRGTFDDSLRLDLFETMDETLDVRDKEFEIDFQAFVMDMAGNIGFSDSDPANPGYINDLGEKDSSKREAGNVLGYYSAHIITLDEKDPAIMDAASATGYYGRNSDKNLMSDRYGVMVVFDGPIAPNSVSNNTFSVELDDESAANVVDHEVDGNYVFLRLASELASDATPKIDITDGEKVEDMAGNETFGKEVDEFEAQDGISPRLTVTLSGGSGSGTGNEGPDKLTNDQITLHVASDEPLQGSPKIAVLCSNLRWNEGDEANVKKDIDDFVANRDIASAREPGEPPAMTPAVAKKNEEYDYTCGYKVEVGDDSIVQDFDLNSVPALARAGENWEYTWKKPAGVPGTDSTALADGSLTAVVYARDRSRYPKGDASNVQNWGSSSAEFTLDTELKEPTDSDLQPTRDGKSKEARPFVLIEFNDNRMVTLDSVELDNVEIASEFEQPDTNRFLYWPLSLSQGDHEVEVDATDAAGNEVSFSYEFEVVARGDFVIALNAGWNAISVPADPIDTAIGSVFTDTAVTTVIGWDTQGWRIAMKRDGVWESNEKYGALNEIRAKYGYWVKSNGFVRQPVELKGGTSRDAGGTPILISIPTEPGWNFVGVVDQDGDQTEDNFGNSLKGSDNVLIPASEYLGQNYVRAYTWDATFSRFDVARPDHTMTIGHGVWVYYPEGTGIAP